MVKVAVLGGSGHVGKTIVDVLRDNPAHSVVVLSRKATAGTEGKAPVIECDYDDADALQATLVEHQIHTVISCLGVHDEKADKVQIALIKAAEKSSSTKRFIPSNWSCPNDPSNKVNMPWAKYQLNAIEHLRATGLEWTEILPGYFLDFWGLPSLKSHMLPTVPAIDIVARFAGIPGTGNEPIAFAYSFDVARVVSRMLDLPEWEERSYILADKLSWNEFLALAEETSGSKFTVNYDSIEKLQQFQITELPNHLAAYPFFPKQTLQWLYAILGHAMAENVFDLPIEKSISRKFPEIEMLSVRELLKQSRK